MISVLYLFFLITKITGETEIITQPGVCMDPNQVFSEKGHHPICDVTCDIYYGKTEPIVCPLVLVQRCMCKRGYLRDVLDGNCIRPDICSNAD